MNISFTLNSVLEVFHLSFHCKNLVGNNLLIINEQENKILKSVFIGCWYMSFKFITFPVRCHFTSYWCTRVSCTIFLSTILYSYTLLSREKKKVSSDSQWTDFFFVFGCAVQIRNSIGASEMVNCVRQNKHHCRYLFLNQTWCSKRVNCEVSLVHPQNI